MKTLKDSILAILVIVVLISMAYLIGKWSAAADRQESAYWDKLNAHVIETWSDGREHPDHQCEYDPSWCNPHYCEHLLKNRAGK